MPHDNHCQNCGKSFAGNINRRFCTDACRKYYKRHGQISLAGVTSLINADKAGQNRTTPRPGGSNLGTYAAKKGIDILAKVIETSFQPPKSASSNPAIPPTNSPLQILTAGASLTQASTQTGVNRVVFSANFSAFLGPVEYPFRMLVWGLPGSGKSTFCMQLANEIAAKQRLLYIAGEEALGSATLIDKQRRTLSRSSAERCVFLNRLPTSKTEWDQALIAKGLAGLAPVKAVFYDSVTKLDITPSYVDSAAHDYGLPMLKQSLAHIFITHAHKDGKQYRGDGSWGHDVDITIRVEKGVATTEKNRFGKVGQTLTIF